MVSVKISLFLLDDRLLGDLRIFKSLTFTNTIELELSCERRKNTEKKPQGLILPPSFIINIVSYYSSA
jgi:hypothetical protein